MEKSAFKNINTARPVKPNSLSFYVSVFVCIGVIKSRFFHLKVPPYNIFRPFDRRNKEAILPATWDFVAGKEFSWNFRVVVYLIPELRAKYSTSVTYFGWHGWLAAADGPTT